MNRPDELVIGMRQAMEDGTFDFHALAEELEQTGVVYEGEGAGQYIGHLVMALIAKDFDEVYREFHGKRAPKMILHVLGTIRGSGYARYALFDITRFSVDEILRILEGKNRKEMEEIKTIVREEANGQVLLFADRLIL